MLPKRCISNTWRCEVQAHQCSAVTRADQTDTGRNPCGEEHEYARASSGVSLESSMPLVTSTPGSHHTSLLNLPSVRAVSWMSYIRSSVRARSYRLPGNRRRFCPPSARSSSLASGTSRCPLIGLRRRLQKQIKHAARLPTTLGELITEKEGMPSSRREEGRDGSRWREYAMASECNRNFEENKE